jgi:hypothetical protein
MMEFIEELARVSRLDLEIDATVQGKDIDQAMT